MKRILSFFAFVALVISFASCNGNAPESKNFQFEVQVTYAKVTITVTPSDPERQYFWWYVKASELEGKTLEQHVKDLLSKESFKFWENNNYIITDKESCDLPLSPDTKYILYACYVEEGGDRGTEIVGDIERKEFTTRANEFQFEVQAMSINANFTITPSDREKEYFWYYVTASEVGEKTLPEYVEEKLAEKTYEEWKENERIVSGRVESFNMVFSDYWYYVYACYVEKGDEGKVKIVGGIEYIEFQTLPKNTLNGWFSISANEEVRFSSANIRQYEASSELDFFFSQWIYASSYTDYPRDLFQWGKTQLPSSVPFRVLFADEWLYLFRKRPNAEKLFAHGKIKNVNNGNDVNGLIILPDNWETPEGISLKTDYDLGILWNENEKKYVKMGEYVYDGYAENTFNANEWRELEFAGAVFLPASRPSANEYGWYWSSSSVGDQYAHAFSFGKDNLSLAALSTTGMPKTNYFAIRPVRIEQYIIVGPFENL